jgi:hypothetical protein
MLTNLSALSNEELQSLFLFENKQFIGCIDSGLGFDNLKTIRLDLKEILVEIKKRNISIHFNHGINGLQTNHQS